MEILRGYFFCYKNLLLPLKYLKNALSSNNFNQSYSMKKHLLFSLLCLLSIKMTAQQTINPTIKNGGAMYEVPEAVPIADAKMPYKIVSEITVAPEKPDSINPALDKLARLVNLHRFAGIAAKNLELVVVIHFNGTAMILSDEAYQKKFGMPNPNTRLINEMANNGVKFYVCGQSLYKRKLDKEPRNPNIKPILSAMLGLSTFQMKGYAFMPQ